VRSDFLDLGKKCLKLVHENLVVTREARAFFEHGIYYVVRDHVEGVPLQRVIDGGRRFGAREVFLIVEQLLAALRAVHRHSACHAGVKPSNIFLCEGNRVVLGDPSLAVQLTGVARERLAYDYRYAAPEMFGAGATLEPASDLYALGCVAYELLCGEPPFVSDNYLELASRHVHDTITPLSNHGCSLHASAEEIVRKLLARSPRDRYRSAEEVLCHLRSGTFDSSATIHPGQRTILPDASLIRLQGAESIVGFDASMSLSSLGKDKLGSPSASFGPSPAQAEQPKRIGAYEIEGTLGQGGMGVVYRARDLRLDRVVALKMLHAMPGSDARFVREAKAVAQLQHPNIVQAYEIGEHQGRPYVTFEYVDGGSLAHKLRADGPLPPRAAAQLVARLARAMQVAHDKGILHRDLKPSNVLMTRDGEPKIGDFGLAKRLDDDSQQQTLAGTVLGTPAYMSPEQAAGSVRGLGAATDVYSLGAILYESLTGRPPFKGATIIEILSQLATEPAKPPSAFARSVPRDLDTICLKCLEKSPANRYAAASDLAQDLERFLAGEAITARAGGLWRSLGRLFRQGRGVRESE
jgi:serine/threonine protein kinase